MINPKKFVFIFLILFFSIGIANANIYLGVVEGYIKDINNNLVAGADVTVEVVGCSGGGCSGTAVSQSNGYYVVGNLDTGPGSTVNVDVIKDDAVGFETDITDEDGLGFVNVTIAKRPDKPTMISTILNRRTVNLYCEPGEDTNTPELPVYVVVQNSPLGNGNFNLYDETGDVSFGSHTWQCRTCNDYVCSDSEFDTFELTNNPPSEPVLVEQTHTEKTTVTFEWISGVDPDGDDTYDEFRLNGVVTSPADSPLTMSNLEKFKEHTWSVRTCDIFNYCSSWVHDSFIVYESDVTTVVRDGVAIRYVHLPSYNITIIYPYFIPLNGTFNIDIEVESNQNLEDFEFSIVNYDYNIILIDEYQKIVGNNAELQFMFQADFEEEKEADFIFLGKKGNYAVLRKEFSISAVDADVLEKPVERIRIIPLVRLMDDDIVLIPAWVVSSLIVAILLIYYYEKRIKRFKLFKN